MLVAVLSRLPSIPAIWLHVIGCAPTYRPLSVWTIDLIFLVCDVWLNISDHHNSSFQDLAALTRTVMDN